MDYKSRNKIPLNWTRAIFNAGAHPEPYDVASAHQLMEIDAPDGSTKFLAIFGDMDNSETSAVFYAIEAPISCPVRRSFERGEISWLEFWGHRGWLLRLTVHLNDGPLEAEYMDPSQMSALTTKIISRLGNVSPFEMKRERLEWDWENADSLGKDPIKTERAYRDYLMRHAHRFANQMKNEDLVAQNKTA
jgi:hypothetical protein